MLTVSSWYGRLGNNIQQCAIGTMAAELLSSQFETIEHDIISKHQTIFGKNNVDFTSKFFYWEGPYKEVDIPVDYIYKNIRRICKEYISKNLKLPDIGPLSDDTLVIHIRSGDLFEKIYDETSQNVPNVNYIPNPLSYYLTLVDIFDKIIVVTESDSYNPIVDKLKERKNVKIQSSTVEEDFATLMAAKNLASSGVGTFCVAAALCSHNIKNFYCTDLLLSEHLNYNMINDEDIKLHVMELKDYIKVGEWKNTHEQRNFILNYEP